MPREKKLRRQLRIQDASPEDFLTIIESNKFERLAKPDTLRKIKSIRIGKELVGWAQISHGQQGEAEIERIEILPKYGKRGIGRKVLGKLSAILLREKARKIILYGAIANGFYNKTNFRPTKHTEHINEREAIFRKKHKVR